MNIFKREKPRDKDRINKLIEKYIRKNQWDKAIEEFDNLLSIKSNDLRVRLRMADVCVSACLVDKAIEEYTKVADSYAKNGFLVQAIAVNKIIARLNPALENVHQRIANLYTQRKEVIEAKNQRKIPEKKAKPQKIIPIFSELKPDEFAKVVNKMEVLNVNKEEFVFKEGDQGDSVYFISDGQVRVIKREKGGKEVWLADLKEGDFFGEFAFLTNVHRQATIQALSPVELLRLSKSDLEEVINRYPHISKVIFKFYKDRVLDDIVAQVPLFLSLKPEERKEILNHVVLHPYKKDTVIFAEGTKGEILYLIKNGAVDVITKDKSGKEIVLSTLRENEYFGEISLIADVSRTATLKTRCYTELIELSRDALNKIVEKFPRVKEVLEESLSSRAEDTVHKTK